MATIRLAKLPDRTAIKLTISVLPELHQRLAEYADFYRQTYGSEEPVAELVPAMLSAFLDSDRAFCRAKTRE
ncbi:DUF2274 domain-containing protein [Nostoc sp. 3335mG]|nr:DUF2274 domain-containing protein [Nostoc sp. 3335mG]